MATVVAIIIIKRFKRMGLLRELLLYVCVSVCVCVPKTEDKAKKLQAEEKEED